MTIYAGHSILAKMNVGSKVFVLAKKLSPYATSVTGGAGAGHGRVFGEVVSIEQTAANAGGLADVTITAAGMAASAVVAEHLVHRRFFAVRSPGF